VLTDVVIEFVVGIHQVDLFAVQLDDQALVRFALVENLVQRDVILPRLVGERIMSLLRELSLTARIRHQLRSKVSSEAEILCFL